MADYIEKDRVIALIEEKQKELCPSGLFSRNALYGTDRDRFDAWGEIIDQVDAIPAADVEPVRHGRYEKGCCTICGYPMANDCVGGGFDDNNYCYHCGAKMDGGLRNE